MTHDELVKFYEDNEKLVYFTLHKRFPEWVYDEDIQQIGKMALWIACKNYVEELGKFSTYAYRVIVNEVSVYFRGEMRQKRTPEKADVSLYEPMVALYGEKELIDVLTNEKPMTIWGGRPLKELLTERQWKIFQYFLCGFTAREIGDRVGISHTLACKERDRIGKIIKENLIDI